MDGANRPQERTLLRLGMEGFRCFAEATLDCDAPTVLFFGDNGAGKTSVLEAIYFLSRGHSFRTRQRLSLIATGASGLTVYGRVAGAGGSARPLGVAYGREGLRLRLDGAPAGDLAVMQNALPSQVLDARVHELLAGGPACRRRYLDWGVFHVEQRFLAAWRRYQRALRQRNAAVKRRDRAQAFAWHEELAATGEAIDRWRRAYIDRLGPILAAMVKEILGMSWQVSLAYQAGWPDRETLKEALVRGWESDRGQGATRHGPHRGDFTITVDGVSAAQRVSRGQAKILGACLLLAQMRIAADRSPVPVLLVDDIASELDLAVRTAFISVLNQLPVQRFVTAVEPTALEDFRRSDARLFHVEQGRLTAMI